MAAAHVPRFPFHGKRASVQIPDSVKVPGLTSCCDVERFFGNPFVVSTKYFDESHFDGLDTVTLLSSFAPLREDDELGITRWPYDRLNGISDLLLGPRPFVTIGEWSATDEVFLMDEFHGRQW